MICNLLEQEIKAAGEHNGELKALDFGAGNGIAGDCLSDRVECKTLVGLDLIPEARDAALRDRPAVCDAYYAMNLSEPSADDLQALNKWDFNVPLTVGALGFGDIPTQGFINAFNLIENDGWIAFNIKDRFMSSEDNTGYHDTLSAMMGKSFDALNIQHYCHRMSMAGDPLYYYAVIGRKKDDISPA